MGRGVDVADNDRAGEGFPLALFLLGTALGGIAGATAGILLSERVARLVTLLIRLVTRRLSEADREELRFELLLQ